MAHLAAAGTAVWASNAGGDITVGSNWVGGNAPSAGDFLDFSAITSAQTLTGSFSDDRVFAAASFAGLEGSTTLTVDGSLHLQTLTNANCVAIGTTGTLVVEGDLVLDIDTVNWESSVWRLLCSNAGICWVKGNTIAIRGTRAAAYPNLYQFRSGKTTHNPIRTGGIVYNSVTGNKLNFYLRQGYDDNNVKSGEFIIGANGISFDSSRDAADVKYTVKASGCTLHSSADWTFGTSGRRNTTNGDLHLDRGSVTFDTANYGDATAAGHEITMEGRIYAPATSGTSVKVTGNGKFTLATVEGDGLAGTCISNTLAVVDTATLQINADANYEIATVSLAAGTTLALPANDDGTFTARTGIGALALPASGTVNLVIDGATPLSRGTYTIIGSIPSGYETKITVSGTAVGESPTLVDDGTSLQLLVGAVTVAWKADASGDIGDAANWEGGALPQAGDKLDFSAIATSGRTLTGSIKDAETGEDVVFSTADFPDLGAGHVMLAGSLHLSTLVNAENLAIGTTGSLVIEGDLVRDTSSTYAENGSTGRLLHSNQGSVTVKGKVVGSADGASLAFYQYRSTKIDGTTYTFNPIRTGGISYYSGYGKTLTFNLRQGYSTNKAPGEFVIGSDGVSISSRATGDSIRYTVDSGCTFHSDADWEFGRCNRSGTTKGDIYVTGSTLTFDTADYDNPSDASKAHTVTMTGRIYAPEETGTGVQVSGNGTFVINTASGVYGLQETCISNTLAVVDSATLQLNESASYEIANLNLAAGTTLSLPYSGTMPGERNIGSLTLPASGTATLRIDGPVLDFGDYPLFSSVPEGWRDHLTVTGTALEGKGTAKLAVVDGKLVLRKNHDGLIIIVR
jgi:hypothetical protein